ncbi:hypothetical protein SHAL103562_09165 [Shewanella algae]
MTRFYLFCHLITNDLVKNDKVTLRLVYILVHKFITADK